MKTTITDCRSFGQISKAIFFILFLSAGLFASVASAQTLTSDHLDYSPGDTAILSGCGFQPGETVTMQVVRADGSPSTGDTPWNIVADANGCFSTGWIVPADAWQQLLLATADGQSSGSHAETTFTDAGTFDTIDFHQASNQNHPTDPIAWINGILNPNNSDYTEGIGVPQRTIFTGIVPTAGNTHALTFGHQAVKGGVRAYDFLISWAQSVQTAADLLNNPVNELQNLFAQKCDGAISAAALPPCQNNTNHFYALLPDVMGDASTISCGLPPPVATNDVIISFEIEYGQRGIDLYGNAPITAASVTFTGYTSSGSDSYANYILNWTSTSTSMVILMAGRSSQSCVSGTHCHGYGPGCGAGSINGGPYHFKLFDFDGHTTGNQDNQLQASAVTPVIDCNNVVIATTNNSTCPNTVATYTSTVTNTQSNFCTNATHSWSISNNTSGATFTTATHSASVGVNYGPNCGSFQLCDTITCDEGTLICCTTIT
ncbi:MAG: hypothetical protein JJE25_03360, partial [Bacteroidia bacterium]|nr:hypothetical protein [Bacteroidia bacterium]